MNHYPSWIHRIPAMIEALALSGADQIDRRMAEQLFDLRRTAAFYLLRRLALRSAAARSLSAVPC